MRVGINAPKHVGAHREEVSCIALTASFPVSRCTIFCLKATENGLVMSHPRSFCRPAGVRLRFGL